MDLEHIQAMVRAGDYLYTEHAMIRMTEERIQPSQVVQGIFSGRLIQERRREKPYPKGLIVGTAEKSVGGVNFLVPLYVVLAVGPQIWIVSVHWNEPKKWYDSTKRQKL